MGKPMVYVVEDCKSGLGICFKLDQAVKVIGKFQMPMNVDDRNQSGFESDHLEETERMEVRHRLGANFPLDKVDLLNYQIWITKEARKLLLW